MRTTVCMTLAGLWLGACGGATDDDTGSTTQTGTSAGTAVLPEIAFDAVAKAKSVDADLTSGTVATHQAVNLFLSSATLVASDPGVQNRMAGGQANVSSYPCWVAPTNPLSQFTIVYTENCLSEGLSGSVFYNEDPLGATAWNFGNLSFDVTRKITGAIGFQEVATKRWKTYDTLYDQPIPDNRAPVFAEIDGDEYAIRYEGGTSMATLQLGEWNVWGKVDVELYGVLNQTVLVGTADETEALGTTKPAEAAYRSLDFLSCRCPVSGLMVQDLELVVSEVTIDLDDLSSEDDGIDDPEVSLAVDGGALSSAEIRMTGCGVYETTVAVDSGVTYEVSGALLEERIQALCDSAVIDDTQRCLALKSAATDAGVIAVEVTANKLGSAMESGVNRDFDASWCELQ